MVILEGLMIKPTHLQPNFMIPEEAREWFSFEAIGDYAGFNDSTNDNYD